MTDWPSFTPADDLDEGRAAEFEAKRAELDSALHEALLAVLRAIASEAATPTDQGERLSRLARSFATIQSGDYVMYSDGRPGFGDRSRPWAQTGWFMTSTEDDEATDVGLDD
ncbi:MAG: hypothetical protein HY828_17620 [Actinobacteria bacterium]|nr:hypothetical protein [Actinomycetota bacterium]